MAGTKEIRLKIKSVQNTRKITKAMEMVAASKMKKAQERMRRGRPYAQRLLNITMHAARANTEYKHPLLTRRATVKRVGVVVVTTDKGLCGGLNTNVLRLLLSKHKEWTGAGLGVDYVAIGTRGLAFLTRMGANVVASAVQLGDRPHLDRVVGPVKALLDKYLAGEADEVWVFYTSFINTMKQEPRAGRIVPVPMQYRAFGASVQFVKPEAAQGSWDYIYEPDARALLDGMMRRYIEAAVYQAVAENMGSEQSARMIAMKAATDNAGKIISELQLIYNKTRQAAITKELSEIVGGAAAV